MDSIHWELAKRDRVLAGMLQRHSGIRVMRVNPWECLIFFILSANNNIPRIQRDMERIAGILGEPVAGDALSSPPLKFCRGGPSEPAWRGCAWG